MPGLDPGIQSDPLGANDLWIAGSSAAMTYFLFNLCLHQADQPLDMGDRGLGLNAMTEIENEGARP